MSNDARITTEVSDRSSEVSDQSPCNRLESMEKRVKKKEDGRILIYYSFTETLTSGDLDSPEAQKPTCQK